MIKLEADLDERMLADREAATVRDRQHRRIDDQLPSTAFLAAALATFATEIHATIIAEGIETANELATLQHIGIPWGQGYHLARPGPLPFDAHQLAPSHE